MSEKIEFDALVDAGSALTGIPVAPAWRENIGVQLAVTLRFARLVGDFPLPDAIDPAPVFTA
jgi:hypothetical protein